MQGRSRETRDDRPYHLQPDSLPLKRPTPPLVSATLHGRSKGAISRESGITRFEAEVLPANAPMLNLFARSGLPVERSLTGGSAYVTIQLAPAT
jgi:hypothetical protein